MYDILQGVFILVAEHFTITWSNEYFVLLSVPVACLWGFLMWRTRMGPSFLSTISGSKLQRQSTPERRRTWHIALQLLFLIVCSSLVMLFILYGAAERVTQRRGYLAGCDIFTGRWVYDQAYPLYNASNCPFAETGFRCQELGRPDFGYLQWRWQPQTCSIPRFDAEDIRSRLKGQRVVFVGDSMGRSQWESFVCLLMADISDKRSVYEVNGKAVTKLRPYLAVRFSTFNFTVEYYRSPYLVRQGAPPKHVPKRVHVTLKLDRIEPVEAKWQQADVLVFNTGHWWTSSKTFGRGCYFQVGDSLKLGMKVETAYRIALSTWASWVESKIDFRKTQVFFRSFEPSHWEGIWKNRTCASGTKPNLNSTFPEDFPHLQVLQDVVRGMNVPVTILNITTLSSYRRDSHVANWTEDPSVEDCMHWCLPGVPDIWNELLYVSLLQKGEGVWAQ